MADVESEPFSGRVMKAVHTAFRREFGLLPGLIRGSTDTRQAAIVGDHFDSLAEMLHHHHGIEDEFVWPLLAARTGDVATSLVKMMAAQHAELTAQLDEVRDGMRNWIKGNPPALDTTLPDDVDRLVDVLREHLDAEENHVVPLMEQHIEAAEWNAMVQKGGADVDPAALLLAFGMMMYESDPAVIELEVANMPAEIRPVIRGQAAKTFADHAVRVYGTANPPRSTEMG
jgi:iron-sulfur cluster repair protein YtfE (RIC family)